MIPNVLVIFNPLNIYLIMVSSYSLTHLLTYLLTYPLACVGQVDIIVSNEGNVQQSIETLVGNVISTLSKNNLTTQTNSLHQVVVSNNVNNDCLANNNDETDRSQVFNYTRSRQIDRPQVQDIINNSNIFTNYIELSGDGKVGRDVCIRGGIALYKGLGCVVLGNYKGHTPQTMQEANYGMASPHGYRFALRLMQLAERFNMPVITLVDTVGAWPTFDCESDGQSEAIATNLTIMAGLTVPIITIMVGEGGSGGALGICMGNTIGMLSGGYFGVISPEGAASILGRYKDDAQKAKQFPLDCQELATAQCIYAYQLKEIGVVDEIIWEPVAVTETYKSYPILTKRINNFITSSLLSLLPMNCDEIIAHRYKKFRSLGTYSLTYSLTYSYLPYSPLTYLTHSLTHLLTRLLTHLLTYSLTHSLTLLTHSLM